VATEAKAAKGERENREEREKEIKRKRERISGFNIPSQSIVEIALGCKLVNLGRDSTE
jgi:hypothetical protein